MHPSLRLLTAACAAEPAPLPHDAAPTPPAVRSGVERALDHLETSSAAWRTDRKCVSCHQVPFTVWALTDAKARGFAVDAAKLDDLTAWSFEFCTTNKHE